MARRGGLEGLGSLVVRVYPGRSKEELEAVRVFGAFMKAMSPRIVKNARPVRLNRGTLTVHTTTSAWATTLQLESDGLLAKLRRHSPDVKITKLVFRVGELPQAAAPLPRELEPEPVVPASELPDDIARQLARVRDDELRKVLAKAAAVGLGTQGTKQAKKNARGG